MDTLTANSLRRIHEFSHPLLACLRAMLITSNTPKQVHSSGVEENSSVPCVCVVGSELQVVPLKCCIVLEPHTQQHPLLQNVPCAPQ